MDSKLYDLMDWAEIEAIVYSEHDHPERILGPHKVKGSVLVQTFLPGAKTVFIKSLKDGKLYSMEEADEEGFFARLLPARKSNAYELIVKYEDGSECVEQDPYFYGNLFPEEEYKKFESGVHSEVYRYLGAHLVCVSGSRENFKVSWDVQKTDQDKKEADKMYGTHFAVWAPNAMRVSVVGNFNQWDGRKHPMIRVGDSGLFVLFVPEVECGAVYKYEIKKNARSIALKSDPVAFRNELRPASASVVTDLTQYQWNDSEWMEKRRQTDFSKSPMLVYEMCLGGWKTWEQMNAAAGTTGTGLLNYQEIAPELARYVKRTGYTHIELFPVMEYFTEESLGYETTGYYSVTARYGSPKDFMNFVDYMHQEGIGVIVDWMATQFPDEESGLVNFDGNCLYEPSDGQKKRHPFNKSLFFDYEKKQVCSFLISNAMFWKDVYHIDGLRIPELDAVLYLDYGKAPGTWTPNRQGGNENFEAVSFFQMLNKLFHERGDGALLLAGEACYQSGVTVSVEEEGLGFDMKWNSGWFYDVAKYFSQDPLFRKGLHHTLVSSTLYVYGECQNLVLPHDGLSGGKQTLISRMPGQEEEKFANVRLLFGYMMAHPGKKLQFMGLEFGQTESWQYGSGLNWEEAECEPNQKLYYYVRKLNHFYKSHPALYEGDYDKEGFEWISCMDADHSIIAFVRRDMKNSETLLVVCNFTPVMYENFKVGAPFAGKYTEIFNSDREDFGGTGCENQSDIFSREVSWDGREHSITIDVAPLGVSIFNCTQK